MCVVSMIYDYVREYVPVTQWTPDTFALLEEVLRKLNKLDAKLGQPDCEDPNKAQYLQEVRTYLINETVGISQASSTSHN